MQPCLHLVCLLVNWMLCFLKDRFKTTDKWVGVIFKRITILLKGRKSNKRSKRAFNLSCLCDSSFSSHLCVHMHFHCHCLGSVFISSPVSAASHQHCITCPSPTFTLSTCQSFTIITQNATVIFILTLIVTLAFLFSEGSWAMPLWMRKTHSIAYLHNKLKSFFLFKADEY